MKITKKKSDAETTRIFPTGTEKQNRPNKTFDTFVSEMFDALVEGAKWLPLNFAADPEAAEREMERRRKREAEERADADLRNRRGFHDLSKAHKARLIMATSPGMSKEDAMKKASLVVGKKRRSMSEATSTNDPNRGRMGRKKPLVPQGMMPDDTKDPKTGKPVRTLGKLHSRLDKLSSETRTKYRQNYGYRTRVAGRGRRLYPSP